MVAGLAASVALLFWGYRSGQFADQDRARYLPLRGEEALPEEGGRGAFAREVYALAGLMAALGVALAIALGIAVLR
jgi:nitrogen fixation-related uncharacterized protein